MTGTCEGCGAQRVLLVEVTLAPGLVVNLCAGRSRSTSYHDRDPYAPKIGCLRRAFEAAQCCPGCGEKERRPHQFAVCKSCRAAIERDAQDGVKPTLHAIDTKLLSTHYPSGEADEKAQKAIEALARIAAAKGPRRLGRDIKDADWCVAVLSSDKHRSAHTGMPRVELDDDQRAALVELSDLIRGLVDAMYLQGRKDGRDLLGGLAHGRISVNDFADRDLRWRAEEEENDDE